MRRRDRGAVAGVDLPGLTEWLGSRRWFGSKDRELTGAAVVDLARLRVPRAVWLAIVRATYADGSGDRWLLVLTPSVDIDAPAIGTVRGVQVTDIADAPDAATHLLAAMASGARLETGAGQRLTARTLGALPELDDGVRLMGVEQSNTSVIVGGAVVVKVIRRLEPGPNPDVELTAALTTDGVDGVPALLGAMTGPDEEAMVTASAFVAGGRGGWELAIEEAAGTTDHGVAAGMADLGRLTATVHQRLGELLPTVEASPQDVQRWRDQLRSEAAATTKLLRDPDAVAAVERAVEAVLAEPAPPPGRRQRIHGDFHLGQVLRDGNGKWWVLDFEGEPARPLEQRRLPDDPVRDVAGMVRSIDYARAQAIRNGADSGDATAWARRAREAFLAGYGADSGHAAAWLRPLELHKLLYEIRYEAANRPAWLAIPLAALGLRRDLGKDDTMATEPRATPRSAPPPNATSGEGAGTAADTAVSQQPVDQASVEGAIAALREGHIHQPHDLLGFHEAGDGGWVVRTWRPGADAVAYLPGPGGEPQACEERAPGLFEVTIEDQPTVGTYRLRVEYPDGGSYDLVDPYGFEPSLGEVDRHLIAEGRHEEAWTVMGANRRVMHGIEGVAFAVWAPNAKAVRVVGEFNSWDGRLHPMRMLGATGIWEIFLPDVADGAHYKYELVTAEGRLQARADPWAKWSEVPPGTASRVFTSRFEPTATGYEPADPHHGPVSIYEVHAGSWRHADGQPLPYRDLAHQLAEYCTDMGFTHVEFLPVAEHPFGGSWGYQVTGQFAPTARFGDPDDFRYLVDHLHEAGIGVIVDWVPAHFPKDEWALRRFDGTALYEHADPRQGEHPDWGTMVFNYERTEVRNFIVASALFWIEAMGVDGLRVDAVASMLYLDYSREEGEWVPNEYGGRENLGAVELLQEVNATVYKRNPRAFTIAEESTAWPGVSRPTHLGGLGFGFKWNMGWMHDTLSYFSKDPIYRRWHHNQLTFGLMYAFSENFVLPLSHDEVVHGKGSLLAKMPGDDWQRFANLRALFGWMWGHPGKKLLFMGGEFGQWREWSEERSLDWHLAEIPGDEGDPNRHQGLQRLVADLNAAYQSLAAMWRHDASHEGFDWIDANNADDNLLSFLRHGAEGDPDVAVIANLSPAPRDKVRIGLPTTGRWEEVVNTDAAAYGGGNIGNLGGVEAVDAPWHGMPASAEVTCPPLGVMWLRGPIGTA